MSSILRDLEEIYSSEELKSFERMKTLSTQAYSHSQKHFENRARYRARYRNELGIEKADWQADIAHPLPHLAVVRKASFCTDAVLGSAGRPIFRVLPWDNINSVRKAQAHTMFIRQQQAQMQLTEVLYNWFLGSFVDGTGILHTYWDNQIETHYKKPEPKLVQEKTPVINPITGQPLLNPNTGEIITQSKLTVKMVTPAPDVIVRTDRPGIEQVDLNDFWPDPTASDLDSGAFHVRRKFMSLKDLERFVKLGRINEKALEVLKQTPMPRRDYSESSQRRYGRYTNFKEKRNERIYEYASMDKDNPTFEILEFYEPGLVSLIGNGEVPLDMSRSIYNAKYPFIRFANLCEHGEFFGLSEFAVPEKLFDHVNQMQNMMFDNWEKHLKGITLIDSSISEIALQQLKEGNPGDVIRVSDVNGVKTERPDLFDGSVVPGMNLLLQEVKDALSVEGAITGTSPGSEVRDSQSFEIFTRISQVTLSITVRRITESLRDLGRQWVNLNKQFLTMPFKIKIAGSNALDTEQNNEVMINPNDPEDMPANLDVDVQLSTIADARLDKELQRMAEYINLAGQSPNFRAEDALLEMGSKIDSFSDTLNFFETDPNEIIKRASLNAYAAGKKNPALAGRLQQQLGNGGGSPMMSDGGGRPAGS